MDYIMTRKGERILVDEALYDYLNKTKWYIGQNGYATRRKTFGSGVSMLVYMHQLVIGIPPKQGLHVDHINHNKLDNRRDNLRWVTPQENQLNRKTKARGVSFCRTFGKWKAYYDHCILGEPKKRVNLGTYQTEAEAVRAVADYRSNLI